MDLPSPKNDASGSRSRAPAGGQPSEARETIGSRPSAITLAASICDLIVKKSQDPARSSGNGKPVSNPDGMARGNSENHIGIDHAARTLELVGSAIPWDIPTLIRSLLLPSEDLEKTCASLRSQIQDHLNTREPQTLPESASQSPGTLSSGGLNKQEGMALAALVAFTQSGFDANQLPPAHLHAVLLGRTVAEWLSLFRTFWTPTNSSKTGARPTQQMVGRFKLIRLLGKGAFGEVHEAIDTSLGRTVAVKLPVSSDADQQDWEYFRREARLAAAVDHPNVVPLLEIGEHNGKPFLVSALIHGLSMKDWLAGDNGNIPPNQAAKWVAMAARGVQAIHDRGILHCDLKTGNIMLDEASTGKTGFATPRITDFGLSGWNGEQGADREGGPMGTPATMAPEQLRGRAALTVRTDVYALGAILHELLFGENHHQTSSIQTIFNRLESNAGPPAAPRPVPQDLDAIRKKCLEPLPENRYHSAEEVFRDLELFLGGRAPVVVGAGPLGRFRRLFLRRPVMVGFAMAASVTLVSMACAGIVMSIQLELAKGAKREAELRADLEASRKAFLEQRQTLSDARILLDSPKPGSVSQSLAKLTGLISGNPDSSTAFEARSLALQASLLPRVETLPAWGGGAHYYLSAWSPSSDWLALSELKGKLFLSSGIHFADGKSDPPRESLSVPPSMAFQAASRRQDGVRSMAIDPSGRWLAAGTRGGFVYIYDLNKKSRNPAFSLDCQSQEIGSLSFMDGARTIICLSNDKSLISIRNAADKYAIASRLKLAHLPVIGIAASRAPRGIILAMNDGTIQLRSPDEPGTVIAQGANLGTAVFPLNNGTILRRQHNKLDICVIREPDAAAGTSGLDLKPVVSLGTSKYWGSEFPPVQACAPHPSGSYLALLTNTATVHLFETFSGRLVCSWHEQGEAVSLAFSPDGKRLVVTGGAGARLYGFEYPSLATPVGMGYLEPEFAWYGEDRTAPELIFATRLDNEPVRTLVSLDGTPTGQAMAGIEYLNSSQSIIRRKDNQGELLLIPVSDRSRSKLPGPIPGIEFPEAVYCSATIARTGNANPVTAIGTDKGIITMALANNKTLAQWNNVSGQGIGRGGIKHLLPIGERIMALGVDGTARLFDQDLHPLKSWRLGKDSLTQACELPLLSGKSGRILVGDEEGCIALIDLERDEPLFSFKAHEGRVHQIASIRHGNEMIILTSGLDGRLKAWSLGMDQLDPLGSISIGTDAHVLATNGDGFVMASRGQTGVWQGRIRDLISILLPKPHGAD